MIKYNMNIIRANPCKKTTLQKIFENYRVKKKTNYIEWNNVYIVTQLGYVTS